MVRTRRVRGIRPNRPLRENVPRVVETRLEEFLACSPALADERDIGALHAMRIAAKRLRYALEIFEVCLPGSRPLIRDITQVQDALGEIRDLDVLLDIIRTRLAALDMSTEDHVVDITTGAAGRPQQFNELRRLMYAQARDRRRIGLLAFLGNTAVTRHERYQAFHDRWTDEALRQFGGSIHALLEPETAHVETAASVEGGSK